MIIKSYEIKKINLQNNQFILFYGENEGFKNEATKIIIGRKIQFQIMMKKKLNQILKTIIT